MLTKLKNWATRLFGEPPPSLSRMRLGPENNLDNPLMVTFASPGLRVVYWNFDLSYNFLLGIHGMRAWAGGNTVKPKSRHWRRWGLHRSGYRHQTKQLLRSVWCYIDEDGFYILTSGTPFRMGVVTMLMTWYQPHYRLCRVEFIFHQWDLGEFDQKGAVQTRWGTREELLHACDIARQHGIDILIDAVLNVRRICFRLVVGSLLILFDSIN